MRRYVTVTRSAAGKTTATVVLTDPALGVTARHSTTTVLGSAEDAVVAADTNAARAFEASCRALDRINGVTPIRSRAATE